MKCACAAISAWLAGALLVANMHRGPWVTVAIGAAVLFPVPVAVPMHDDIACFCRWSIPEQKPSLLYHLHHPQHRPPQPVASNQWAPPGVHTSATPPAYGNRAYGHQQRTPPGPPRPPPRPPTTGTQAPSYASATANKSKVKPLFFIYLLSVGGQP